AWAGGEAAAALALGAARMSDRLDAATAHAAPPADVAQALVPAVSRLVSTPVPGRDTVPEASVGISAGAAGTSACATSRHPDTDENCRPSAEVAVAGAVAEVAATGAAARLFATAHAAPHMAQYAGLPGVMQRLMDAQVEAVYLGAESVQRRQLAAAMAAPAFPSRLAAGAAEAAESGSLRAGLALLGWTLEFLRRARLLTDARQGAGFDWA